MNSSWLQSGKGLSVEALKRLGAVFYPRSIAVLGVTQTPGTVPHDIFSNILMSGYTGRLYPVAPGKSYIEGIKAYRYVLDIPDAIDLAVVVFPANVCDRALAQCAEKGVKAAIIISAGFREVGPAGVERERKLKDICAEHGIALVGPNCLGVINTDPAVAMNASFARKMPAEGRIAFLSQSGALCTAVLDYARDKEIGFSKFVSFGNKAGVTEMDLIHYLHADPRTDVIMLYLEELRDGRGLIEAARKVASGPRGKPILAIKSGRTPQGAHAAASHTGSLAGQDAICDAVFRQAGIIRVNSIDEMFNSGILLAYQPMPAGNRLAIVTNAGGPGVMATDSAVSAGLEIPGFEPATTATLKAALPATANLANPVDVIGDARAERYSSALQAVLADPNVDEALVILTPQSMTDIEQIAHGIVEVQRHARKPIAASFMGATDVAPGVHILQAARIPHYILPEWACRAMADVQRVRELKQRIEPPFEPLPVDRDEAAAVIDAAPDGFMPEDQALAVLKAYGLPVPRYELCADAGRAVEFAEQIGYPVTVRMVCPQIIHKTEVNAVVLNLRDADAVRRAFDQTADRVARALPGAEVLGAVVRRMIPAGHEVILGAKRDAVFGATLMFGLGGIFVGIFRDVTFALAPISLTTAAAMVRQVRAYRLLAGARGAQRADIEGVEQCLVRLGQLVSDFPRIAELDINPLIVGAAPDGCNVADVRIRLERSDEQE
ncbi:MAG TPA: acetate--CoA ligase family protein [Phycisphaerae bacterium]|nr:acetate--CoA ligase family protein [Phycisphaerae bacterium]